MNKEWKFILGTGKQYSISNNGEIVSNKYGKNKIIKPLNHNRGYLVANIFFGGKQKTMLIHRIVASHFIENKLNLLEVNHIDGNKHNNSHNNLEWVTRRQNVIHALENGLWCGGKK